MMRPHELDHVLAIAILQDCLRGHLVSTVRACVVVFEPLLDTMVSKDVLALGQSQWGLGNVLRCWYSVLVVADHTG